jgi:MATE family multidrug resistance protein
MGKDYLNAASIAFALQSMAFIPVFGLSIGTSILAGQEIGAGRQDNVYIVARKGVYISLAINALVLFVLMVFPRALLTFFDNGKNMEQFLTVRGMATTLIRMSGAWIILDAVSIIVSGILRAAGDTVFLMYTSGILSFSLLAIPAYVIIVAFQSKNLPLVWLFIILYIFSMCVAFVVRFFSGRWKQFNVIS